MNLIRFFFVTIFLFFPYGNCYITEIHEIVKKGEIKIGMVSQDKFPFFFKTKQGVLIGTEIEMAKELGKELGVSISFDRSFSTFDSIIDAVNEGKIDLGISNLSQSLARAKKVYFTTPYIQIRRGLALNRKLIAENKESDVDLLTFIGLSKFKIGALANSNNIPVAKRIFQKNEIVPQSSNEEGYTSVKDGKIAAYFTSESNLYQYISEHPEQIILVKIVFFRDILDSISIAVRPEQPHFLYFLNMFLDKKEGKITVENQIKKYQDFIKARND